MEIFKITNQANGMLTYLSLPFSGLDELFQAVRTTPKLDSPELSEIAMALDHGDRKFLKIDAMLPFDSQRIRLVCMFKNEGKQCYQLAVIWIELPEVV